MKSSAREKGKWDEIRDEGEVKNVLGLGGCLGGTAYKLKVQIKPTQFTSDHLLSIL